MTPWIKISNGLPPLEERVLGWDGRNINLCFLTESFTGSIIWALEDYGEWHNVEAWTSLPKPPGEE